MSGMRTFGYFLQALFWHGGRRWLALGIPNFIVFGLTLTNHFLVPLPSDLALAFLWNPSWWVWVLASSTGVLVAAYLAWREQFRTNRTLTRGMPKIVLADPRVEIEPFDVYDVRS